MKPTKKAKRVVLNWKKMETTIHRSVYECPCCKTTFVGTLDRGSKIVRFKCDCGQELIVNET